MPNLNMYVTVKRVNPERLYCPVTGCQEEGKEENRVETPCIAGLGKLMVYLCDTHATALAVTFLDERALSEEIEWDEPTKDAESPARPGEAGALYAFMGWLTSREQVSGPFSRSGDAEMNYQAGKLIQQFIDMQGWPEPDENWHHCIKPFEEKPPQTHYVEEAVALGRAHLENAVRAHLENYRAHGNTALTVKRSQMQGDIGYGELPPQKDDFPW